MNSKKYTIDMVNGPLMKNIFLFAVPLMFTNFLQILFNAADTVVVGKFAGQDALAAVGATGSLVFFLTAIFNGLSTGTNVIIARLLGSKDETRIQKAVHTSITIAILSGILLFFVGGVFSKPLLQMMSTPENIIDKSSLYMKIYFAGVIFLLVYNFGAAILRSKGDTKRPLYFLMFSGVINVLLNLVFVIVLKISVAGVALATVISEAISAFLVIYTLIKETDETHLNIKKLGIDFGITFDIMKIGIPAGIQGMVFSISNVVIQSSINSFGSSTIVAGNAAAANLEGFVYIGMMAFTQACITFTSQNIGAHKESAVKKIMLITLLLTTISGFAVGLVVWFFGDFFLGLYANDAKVIEVGMIRMTYVGLLLALNGILDIFVCSMRGMGYSTVPTLVSVVGICGVRLLWIWNVFAVYNTLPVIYMCFPISWIVTLIAQALLWFNIHHKMMKEVVA